MSSASASRRRAGQLLAAPLRRRGLLIAPTLLAALAAAGLAALLPARYRAAVILQAEWGSDDPALAREPERELANRRSRAVRLRVTDSELLERTLEQATPYGVGGGAATLARQLERLRSDLRVRPMAATTFAVEFEHGDPEKAALVPNLLTRLLVEETEAARRVAESAAGPSAEPPRFELVAPARVPAAPESRRPLLFAVAGALVGLLVGIAAAVAAEARDPRVTGPEDLDGFLKLPLLATIPEVKTGGKQD